MTAAGRSSGPAAGAARVPGARWWRHRPLRTRLATVATVAVAVVVLGVCAAAFVVIRFELNHQLELNLKQSANQATQRYRHDPPQALSTECRFLAAPACAQTVPAQPARDAESGYPLPVGDRTRQVASGRSDAYYTDVRVGGHPARMLTTHVRGTDHALQVALRSDTVQHGVRQAAWLLGAVGCAGVLLAGGLGYWVSRTGLAPVARLTATAERIAATRDAGHRIALPPGPPEREDEIARLAGSFNTMLDALEQSVTAQRRLVADASHELRTPLTALRTNTELLARTDRLTTAQRDRAAGGLQRQLREVTQLVNDLIELARDEEPAPLVEQVPLPQLAEHAVRTAREHWPGVNFSCRVDRSTQSVDGAADDPLTVPGVPARLSRLLANLLDNAAKFSTSTPRETPGADGPPQGSTRGTAGGPGAGGTDGAVGQEGALGAEPDPGASGGVVEVWLGVRDGAAEVTVRDHGPGISAGELPQVFDRFYRSPAARSLPGSGLGLAMARQIARAHGAALTAEQPPGGGARFRLRFPRAGGSTPQAAT